MEENVSIFIFAIPRKAGLLVQILMKLDTLNFSSLREMSLLFLRHTTLFEKLQMANGKCSFESCPVNILYIQDFVAALSIHSFLPILFIAFFH